MSLSTLLSLTWFSSYLIAAAGISLMPRATGWVLEATAFLVAGISLAFWPVLPGFAATGVWIRALAWPSFGLCVICALIAAYALGAGVSVALRWPVGRRPAARRHAARALLNGLQGARVADRRGE
ncbi:hypothetical protein [Rhodanobacter sp. FW106-PBR-R2A-1-13]|uniref:hypothetical protein n=1 Tax=Rhodanobacter sp. FW106-PBR-R2A-1-13 TaxID=3454845 RepID=UPI0034E4F999